MKKNLRNIVRDTTLPKKQREAAARELMGKILNPIAESAFDPATFDRHAEDPLVQLIGRKRKRPPRRFPNPHRMKPKEIMEGQMVGMYESKQELYLLLVELSERLSDIEDALQSAGIISIEDDRI